MLKFNHTRRNANEWTREEHAKYLESLERFPNGPWKARAAFIGTRTTRQVMTHYQKINLRLKRHARGLLPAGRPRGASVKRRVPTHKPSVESPPATRDGSNSSACLKHSAFERDVNTVVSLPQSPLSPAAAALALDASFADDTVFDRISWELLEWEAFALVVEWT